jgi:hypothetical protein
VTAPNAPSVRLSAAAALVDGWPEPFADPLAALLRAEADHAAELDRDAGDWERYPRDAVVLRIADGVLEDQAQRDARERRSARAHT